MTTAEKTLFEEITGTASEIIRKVRKLIREGNARSIVIKNKNGRILFQSQLTAGIAGTAFVIAIAPIVSAITMFVLFINNVKVFVEKNIDPDTDENEIQAEVVEIDDEDEENTEENDDDKT